MPDNNHQTKENPRTMDLFDLSIQCVFLFIYAIIAVFIVIFSIGNGK